MKYRFITIEGCEGSGKTSVIRSLCEEFEKRGIAYLSTREPGGSKISEQIRNVILNVDNTKMDYMTEALLYAASRRQHLEEIVKPALNDGKVVLCDRYLDSSLAYQGYARGIGIEEVYNINMYATSGFLPDLTIYIDIPVEVGLERIKENNRDVNRLDLEKVTFHNKVREGYLKVAEMYPNRIKVIDGNADRDTVFKRVKEVLFK